MSKSLSLWAIVILVVSLSASGHFARTALAGEVGVAGAGSVQPELEELRERISALRERMDELQALRGELAALKERLAELEGDADAAEENLEAEHPPRQGLATSVAERIEALEERIGVGVGGQLQVSVQGLADDGKVPALAPQGRVADGQASYDLIMEVELGSLGEAYLQAEGGDGLGLNDEVETNLSPNDDVGPTAGTSLGVSEAWVELGWLESPLVLTVGKVDLSNYFDANAAAGDEVSQFLGSAFVTSPAIEFPADNGLGARLAWRAVPEFLTIQVGAAEGDSDFEDLFEDGFAMGEVELVLKPFGRTGQIRGGAWVNSGEHPALEDPSDTDRQAWGMSASLDQEVADSLVLFGRFSYQDQEVFDFPYFWSGGLELLGEPWGRAGDALGVGFAQLIRNTHRPVAAEPPRAQTNEAMLETYYRLSVNHHLSFGPHFQVIFDPAGVEEADEVVVVGGRMVVGF